ncbi:MAG: hypothetical protein IKA88_04165 [Clostridia bacterium]|nr:hypothetical protein [Clostridia bacterium]
MEKIYVSPSLCIYRLNATDILTVSQEYDDGENTKALPDAWFAGWGV